MRWLAILGILICTSPVMAQRKFGNRVLRHIHHRSVGRSIVRHVGHRVHHHHRRHYYRPAVRLGYSYGYPYGFSLGYSGSYFSFGHYWPGYYYQSAVINPYPAVIVAPVQRPLILQVNPAPAKPAVPEKPPENPPPQPVPPQNPLPPQNPPPPPPPADAFANVAPKISNLQSRRMSRHFMELGDKHFRDQKWLNAIDRYKAAAKAAPDLAEPWFRQGHSYVALQRYAQAKQAFARALSINPDIERGGFRLDAVYGGQRIAKTGDVESLAKAALEDSDNADLFYLLGVFLYYDGDQEKAAKFFAQSALLGGADQAHLQPFLKRPRQAKAEPGRLAL